MRDDGRHRSNVRLATPPPTTRKAAAMETLDLHGVFRDDRAIYRTVQQALFRCSATGVDVLEIIPGRGSGTLKRRVLAFLNQQQLRRLYARIEEDPNNAGRILVRFR
ncbi:Smr/MutS family protein [Catenulispora pinistramenti]|nr:Smr/MutS family protein [Catenulispora pinistramenti]